MSLKEKAKFLIQANAAALVIIILGGPIGADLAGDFSLPFIIEAILQNLRILAILGTVVFNYIYIKYV